MNKRKCKKLAWFLFAVTMLGCAKSEITTDAGITIEVYAPGIRQPKTISLSDSNLPDDALVIGVSVRETYRAYLIAAFGVPPMQIGTASPAQVLLLGRHVVNDLIDGVPITVTHCDDNVCSRVFVGDGSESLDLAVCGRTGGQMNLQLYRQQFLQNAAEVPLADHPFEMTTWGLWKADHPDTDLYIGK